MGGTQRLFTYAMFIVQQKNSSTVRFYAVHVSVDKVQRDYALLASVQAPGCQVARAARVCARSYVFEAIKADSKCAPGRRQIHVYVWSCVCGNGNSRCMAFCVKHDGPAASRAKPCFVVTVIVSSTFAIIRSSVLWFSPQGACPLVRDMPLASIAIGTLLSARKNSWQ